MRRKMAFAALPLFLAALQAQSQAPAKSSLLVLRHANVIDGVSAQPLRDATVVLREGRIESVSSSAAGAAPDAQVLDLKGRWLLPGFVDAHAHLADLRAARAALASGVTTARSLGTNHFADTGIRELNHAGVADLPDVMAAGYHVRPRPAEEFFLDLPQMRDLMSGAAWKLKEPEAITTSGTSVPTCSQNLSVLPSSLAGPSTAVESSTFPTV